MALAAACGSSAPAGQTGPRTDTTIGTSSSAAPPVVTLSASLSGEEPAAGMVEVTPSTGRICVSVFPSGDAVAEIAEGASGAPLLRLPISPPKGGAPTTAVPRAAACTDDAALASRLATAADGRFVLTVRPAAGAPVTGQGPLAMSATSG